MPRVLRGAADDDARNIGAWRRTPDELNRFVATELYLVRTDRRFDALCRVLGVDLQSGERGHRLG